jgi:hypothetical protein
MGLIFNPAGAAGLQLTSEKNQSGGYLGISSEGNVSVPKELKVEGKFAVNGAVPVAKATDCGTSNTGLTITLITEVAAAISTDRTKLNEIRTCLRNAGLMA